jgi:iron complex transport system ATP-binding protein
MSWTIEGLSVRFAKASRDALTCISCTVAPGSFVAVVGPNGAGKSTLLSAMVGVRAADQGRVLFTGRDLTSWPRREFARTVGVVPQLEDTPFPLSVREYVAMGRYPHQGPWQGESSADVSAIDAAIARADLDPFRDRLVQTLSGGERQRARIARALAQQPTAFALDEPTAALDMSHEMAIFELMRAEADAGHTVVLVTHHLNLAARYADRLLLLDRGALRADGTPEAVLTASLITSVFGWPVAVAQLFDDSRARQVPHVVPRGAPNGLRTD